jgi:hypothetical protein
MILFFGVLFDIFKRTKVFKKKEAPVNLLTDSLEGQSTLRLVNVLVCGWVGGKYVSVDL